MAGLASVIFAKTGRFCAASPHQLSANTTQINFSFRHFTVLLTSSEIGVVFNILFIRARFSLV